MTETQVARILDEGVAILKPVLASHGFTVNPAISGRGSGGAYASCQFVRGNRRLRLHFRYSLGLVEYDVATVTLSHEDYMWSVLGRRDGSSYPGFSDDPLDGFRRLKADLDRFGHDFFSGTDETFIAHAERVAMLKRTAPRLPA